MASFIDTSCGLRVAMKSTTSRASTTPMVMNHRVGEAMDDMGLLRIVS